MDDPADTAPEGRPATPANALKAALPVVVPPLLISFAAGVVAYVTLGPTVGLFFAGVVIATLVTPPLVLAETGRLARLLTAAAVTDGVAVAWLFAAADPSVSIFDWIRCLVLLVGYVLALWGVASVLVRLAVPATVASAITVFFFLAWLGWPVWLSPWLAGRAELVGWLAPAHPLLALDGTLRHLGPAWTERHWMYTTLTVLNQDVMYELPRGVWRAALLHAGVGVMTLSVSWRRRGTRRAAAAPPTAVGGL